MDMKNGYNAVRRAAALRALRGQPRLRTIMPLLERLLGVKSRLYAGPELEGLFAALGGAETREDSEEGFHQGGALSSGGFCVTIHEGVKRLDAECRAAGGGARFLMDDGYAFGPAEVVFAAVERFAEWLLRELDLELQYHKSSCYSEEYDLEACPHRRASCLQPDGRPIPIGSILITDPSDPRERARGIEVAGVPVGEEAYVREYLAEKSLEIVSYVDKTLIQLQSIDPCPMGR